MLLDIRFFLGRIPFILHFSVLHCGTLVQHKKTWGIGVRLTPYQ